MTDVVMATSTFLSIEKEMAQALEGARLEMEYEQIRNHTEIIHKDEEIRQLRVQLLLHEYDEQTLQDELADVEKNADRLQTEYEDTWAQFVEAQGQASDLQNEVKMRLREAEQYRVELQALNNVSADSTKVLTEKLALSRELATLKPEVEHLRSQAASNQNALAEKLALQREVNSLQVELETERRALQRVKSKDAKSNDEDNQALTQLEELRKELAKEKRETQRIEREMRKQVAEIEGQKTISESKLDAFRNKLRTTKEQLKQAQDELKGTQEQLEKAQSATRTAQRPTSSGADRPANPRKRPVARFDPDMTIGTPGESHAAKRARISTAPGEKSTFSITPFLNKTTSILADSPESPHAPDNEKVPEEASPAPAQGPLIAAKVAEGVKSKEVKSSVSGGKAKPRPLQQATAPRVNASIGAVRKPLGKLSLPKVSEEDDGEEEAAGGSTKSPLQSEPAKKRQKVLGVKGKSTLFDDDDAEQPKPKGRAVLGASKGLGLRGGGLSLASKPKSLAEFSPLKKDKRAV